MNLTSQKGRFLRRLLQEHMEIEEFPFRKSLDAMYVQLDLTRPLQLSQELFYENGTVYDQLLILNSDFEVDPTLLAEQGLPFYAGKKQRFAHFVSQLLTYFGFRYLGCPASCD